jgi:hypothetical protein
LSDDIADSCLADLIYSVVDIFDGEH